MWLSTYSSKSNVSFRRIPSDWVAVLLNFNKQFAQCSEWQRKHKLSNQRLLLWNNVATASYKCECVCWPQKQFRSDIQLCHGERLFTLNSFKYIPKHTVYGLLFCGIYTVVVCCVIGCHWPALQLAFNQPIRAIIPAAHLCLLPVAENQKATATYHRSS